MTMRVVQRPLKLAVAAGETACRLRALWAVAACEAA